MDRLSSLTYVVAWIATALFVSSASTSRLHAQDSIRPMITKSATHPTRSPPRAGEGKPSATVAKSLWQRIFDPTWVLFPTQLTLVIVLLAGSMLFVVSGCWGAARFAHLLRHLKWEEPPRRLKRGELGAAGANVAFEFEERLNTKRVEDEERDRQIAWLRTAVLRLSAEHNEIVSALTLIDGREIDDPWNSK